jgi:hypothetical protein
MANVEIGSSNRIYPNNTKLKIIGDTLEMSYSLNISENLVKFLPKEKVAHGKKFFLVITSVKVRPITEGNIEVAYTYLKSLTQNMVRQAKLKLAQENADRAREAVKSNPTQVRLF